MHCKRKIRAPYSQPPPPPHSTTNNFRSNDHIPPCSKSISDPEIPPFTIPNGRQGTNQGDPWKIPFKPYFIISPQQSCFPPIPEPPLPQNTPENLKMNDTKWEPWPKTRGFLKDSSEHPPCTTNHVQPKPQTQTK